MLGTEKHRPGFSSFQTQSLRHLSWAVERGGKVSKPSDPIRLDSVSHASTTSIGNHTLNCSCQML
ncbi:hypothetical protein F7725_009876 [Dissostichus mawsoni]|uniref:Uncharacterized protein n=1 Tax=Dissostichus mawsoni TaxID=36200 RepID=A0A7J5XPV7_DISMA|nr:hypothetical protein F7725_009876 [Dissostichus mawsoni]